MNTNLNVPAARPATLTRFDTECIGRLLKAGNIETAVKIYREACRCSNAEAERAIGELSI